MIRNLLCLTIIINLIVSIGARDPRNSIEIEKTKNGWKRRAAKVVQMSLNEDPCGLGCSSCTENGCEICYRRKVITHDTGIQLCDKKILRRNPLGDYLQSDTSERAIICTGPYSVSEKNLCVLDYEINGCYHYTRPGKNLKCTSCWKGIPKLGGTVCEKITPPHPSCLIFGHVGQSVIKCLRCKKGFTLDYNNQCQLDTDGYAGEGCLEMKGPFCSFCDGKRGYFQYEPFGLCQLSEDQ